MESRYVPRRFGDDLLSVDAASPAEAQALAEQLRKSGKWLEVVGGIDSVVVRFDIASLDAQMAAQYIEASLAEGIRAPETADTLLEIPVVYGGEQGFDLEELSAKLGLSADEIIDLHSGRDYVVDMVGFTPGFAFIGGLDERLSVPRRKEPRQRVPAGSIAIADGRTGIYSLASPGGWTVIGRTPYELFDPEADDPLVVKAGMRVRFKAVRS